MESMMGEDIADLKHNTQRIVESLTQVVRLETTCTCKEKLSGLKKDLQDLEAKVSIKEEDCRRQRNTRGLTKHVRSTRFDEFDKKLKEIEITLKSVQSQSKGARTVLRETPESRGFEVATESATYAARSEQQIRDVRIKHQSERLCTMDFQKWTRLATEEEAKALTAVDRPEDGTHTVLLLDISESMASGDSWRKAKHFVNTFLSGLEEHSKLRRYERNDPIDEHVSLVTFGHRTETLVPMTKDFRAVRDAIGKSKLELGGPSPLLGGLLIAAKNAGASNKPGLINGVFLQNRIIVITDGQPTELSLFSGPDVADESQIDEERTILLSILDQITNILISVFFIEVPNCETTLFHCIRDHAVRNVFDCDSGRRLAKRNHLCLKFGFDHQVGDFGSSMAEDLEDMHDLSIATRRVADAVATRKRPTELYRESNCKTLPIIGSRVRRGPDWKWDNQDKDGPGTVVGHCEDDVRVWVQWDNTEDRNVYRYGESFDVLVVDEIRHLKPGQRMAVGCHVKPGRDGKFHNVHNWNKGVVIKMTPPKAQVRWDSGIRGDYSYGEDGKFEIELCESPVKSTSIDSGISLDIGAARSKRTNKNKSAK
ncbi:hypothetical protein DPMN_151305 [Dreissena polymorpha]|uniref:VWFA domain-containing protein n=1 Tax=Dreissena polymorpha TaxID=45954 RepID=A0A9D4J6U2_DREPO|nr:hypothetical protein DPMN_151305 [Dreissena polymorpha]